MRKQRTMLGFALLIGAWIVHTPASAQDYRGTTQQQMACTPDVWRLCSDQVPDVSRIVACLQRNAPRLSPGCRAVFETGAASPPAGPNGRIVRPQPYPPPPYAMRPPPPYYGAPPPPYYDDDDDYRWRK
jgi:Cysteine rich repeat